MIIRKFKLGLKDPTVQRFNYWQSIDEEVNKILERNNVGISDIIYDQDSLTKSCVVSYKSFYDFCKAFIAVEEHSVSNGIYVNLLETVDIRTNEKQIEGMMGVIQEYKESCQCGCEDEAPVEEGFTTS